MPAPLYDPDEYELVNRESFDSDEIFDLDDADFQSQGLTSRSYSHSAPLLSRFKATISRFVPRQIRRKDHRRPQRQKPPKRTVRWPYKSSRRCCFWLYACLGLLAAILSLTAVFRPSYTDPPKHYHKLRKSVEASRDHGRANPENQKIFIASSIYDEGGHLLGGAWGESVLQLIDILGRENVYLSIYENESGPNAQVATTVFEQRVQCKHSLVYDTAFTVDDVPHIMLPDGSERVKRIAYLAEVRNRALLPLQEEQSTVQYDRILYLNDVIFDPIEATQLLLATNIDEHGLASYRAACAVDFINPFKFYDTFATRDFEGYSMGVPFFPWFTGSGQGISRLDVRHGRDAVRVKSCWGGMVAFDAKPFQASKPLRFRASPDLFWESSECCLIHADLMNQAMVDKDDDSPGIFMNPFVRVAYSQWTLGWLHFTRRFERLYIIPHSIVNHLVGLPWLNPRRTEEYGTQVEETVWVPDSSSKHGGSFQKQPRETKGDGFCGFRTLQLIKETQREGEKNWETMPVPSI
ncbi:MAG: hypothetical protein Q9164_000804 [Protoblastenia rupestris]